MNNPESAPIPAIDRSDEARVNILIVDDRAENLLAVEAILEPLGQRLIRATSGQQALKQILLHDIALILLDVQMPGMNGFECAQLIKSRERSRHIPIIFLTAISKEEAYVFRGYSVGAVDYIFKPFQPDILRSKVAVFVDLHQKTVQLQRQSKLLRDIERREMELRHAAELRATESRLGEIVDAAMDAIILFDGQHRITLFNHAAERMFGASQERMLGSPVHAILPGEAREQVLERLCDAAQRDRAQGIATPGTVLPVMESFVGVRANGETFPVEASVSCVQAGDERIFTVIARDVTERQRADEALRRQAADLERSAKELQRLNDQLQQRSIELEKAMAARSRFYASMSHELRTPINAILGYNTLMLENIYGPLNERQIHGLQRTQKAAKHLLELVNDVLDLSKIEAGKIEVQLQPVTVPTLIEDLFVTVRPMADERGSELSLEHTGPPVTVITDPRRVRQILLNLLSNAIKFGGGRPIRIVSRGTDEGGVTISVVDQGVGIAPNDLDRVFDEFVQLSTPREQEGTGLGLPISKRLATLLQGTLHAASTPGKGSCFTLTLPAEADITVARSLAIPPWARGMDDPASSDRRSDSEIQTWVADERKSGSRPPRRADGDGPLEPEMARREHA